MRLFPHTARLKPPALRRGDRIAIVAPGSPIERERLEAGCATLRRMGYDPVFDESILDRELYFAGSVRRRARELEQMFEREDVRAIVCARGGYGTNYLLEELDLARVSANPKIFVGYSDVTTLLTYFCDSANLVTFHGPMLTKDFAIEGGVDSSSWEAATGGARILGLAADLGARGLCDGLGEGTLYGGCLSMLVASLGTPFEIDTRGAILFLEDVGVKPYQIDRMLMQLKLAGKLSDVRGIVFGEMVDCVQPGGQDYTLEEIILRIVGDLHVPVAFGLRSGHVSSRNITLPLGIRASLAVESGTVVLRILETSVAGVSALARTPQA